ncbi:MAG: hypothetical protein P8181_14215, partial [bacterium]
LSLRNEILRVSGGKASVLAWMLRHADGVLVNSKKGKTYLEQPRESSRNGATVFDEPGTGGERRVEQRPV